MYEKILGYFNGVDWTNLAIAGGILVAGIIISYFLRGLVSGAINRTCLLYTSPSPRDQRGSRMPSSA